MNGKAWTTIREHPFGTVLGAILALAVLFVAFFVRTEKGTGRKIIRFTMYKYEKYDKFRRAAGKSFEEKWNREHPGDPIEVRYEPIGGPYPRKINAEVVADTLHDLFIVPVGSFQDFVERGVILDLEPYIAAANAGDSVNSIHARLLAMCRYNGKTYTLPYNTGIDVLYYNRTLFDKKGIPYPNEKWTWEDARAAARKLTERDASGRTIQFGLVLPRLMPELMKWMGGSIFSEDRTVCTLNSAGSLRAAQFLHDLTWKDRVLPTPSEEQGEAGTEAFKNNHAAMFAGGRWYTALFKIIPDLDWAVAPLPLNWDGERRSSIAGIQLGVSARSRHPEIAFQLALYLESQEQVQFLVDVGDSVPLRRKDFDSFLNEPGRPKGENRAYELALDNAQGTDFENTPYLSGALVSDALNQAVQRLYMSPDSKPAEVMKETKRELDRLISLSRKPLPKPNVPLFAATMACLFGVLLFLLFLYLKRGYRAAPVSAGAGLRRSAFGYLFILPNVAGFLLFTLVPVVFSFLLAFTNWDLFRWPPKFVGFQNFTTLLSRPEFWKYFWNTLFLMAGIPIGMAGSLMLAVILNQRLRGRLFFRSAFFLPSFTAGVAIFMLWKWLFNAEFGLLNLMLSPVLASFQNLVSGTPAFLWKALGGAFWLMAAWDVWAYGRRWLKTPLDERPDVFMRALGITGTFLVFLALYFIGWVMMNLPAAAGSGLEAPRWLSAVHSISLGPLFANAKYPFDWAKPAFLLVGFWCGVGGYNMILYLAGLQGISPELYEASAMDGATRWQQFLHVTWPLLSPTTFFIFVISIIGGFQGGFEAAYVMTEGGPAGATTTLSYHIYQNAFEFYKMGYAAAVSWVLFLMVFVITLINWRFGGRNVNY